jgi:hypothetical protein
MIDSGNYLASVSCSSTTFCVAVDSAGNILGYNGKKWSHPLSIDGTNYLEYVSSVGKKFSVSVDDDKQAIQTPGAKKGTSTVIDTGDASLKSVPCASTKFCVTLDYGADYMVG